MAQKPPVNPPLYRQRIQLFPDLLPPWKVGIEMGNEYLVVVPFDQVDELVGNYVFNCIKGFFSQLGVEADAPACTVTRTPLGAHGADQHLRGLYAQ